VFFFVVQQVPGTELKQKNLYREKDASTPTCERLVIIQQRLPMPDENECTRFPRTEAMGNSCHEAFFPNRESIVLHLAQYLAQYGSSGGICWWWLIRHLMSSPDRVEPKTKDIKGITPHQQ
jgi:hypothetical protein